MKKTLFFLLALFVLFIGCGRNTAGPIISQRFIDENTYEIVCSGRSAEDAVGIARAESAKRSAMLNIYYYLGRTFDDTVTPDRDGRIEKVVMTDGSAVVYYIIKKENLRKRLRRQ